MDAIVLFFTCLMLTASVAFGKQRVKFCARNEHCPAGECCLGEQCTAFLNVGEQCNTLTQILSLQCPCQIGSSCIKIKCPSTSEGDDSSCVKTKCHSILQGTENREIIEDRDRYHIESNTIDE